MLTSEDTTSAIDIVGAYNKDTGFLGLFDQNL